LKIDAQTRFYFLLGNPVAHSLSPLIHNTGFCNLGLNAVYLAAKVDPAKIGEAVAGLRALAAAGGNVTSPLKELIIPHLDSVAEISRRIESVNTFINRDGKLHGASTDGEGFCRAFYKVNPSYETDDPVLLIGAGGSARAIAYSLADHGFKNLYLANRSPEKAQKLAGLIEAHHVQTKCHPLALEVDQLKRALRAAKLIVYSLPTESEQVLKTLAETGGLSADIHFFDLRYKQAESVVMQEAARAGAKVYNGLRMLFEQALLAFELFTGLKPPSGEICAALSEKAAGGVDHGCI
jgi:shikimate dehydrogenase